jgi:NADH-quinone oxidoreductase subunit M
MQIISHGISTGALFALVGALQERTHTRELDRLGGLWETMPGMGGVAMLFSVASLGLPGLGNFVGEFLVLLGTYQVSVLAAVLAALGLIGSTVYALWIIQKAFHGENKAGWKLPDFSAREMAAMLAMIVVIVWLGLYPQPMLDTARQAIQHFQPAVAQTVPAPPLTITSPYPGSIRPLELPPGGQP